jgi:ornithine decarboxylase
MSKIETLPAHFPAEFSISAPSSRSTPLYREDLTCATNALVSDLLSMSPSIHITADPEPRVNDDHRIFPSLPPLLYGHPEVHLRNGIMNASRLAAANEPDAEKAFFVADLGQVYKQHLRWKKALPGIQPFYGLSSVLIFYLSSLIDTCLILQLLNATRTRTSSVCWPH